MLRTRSTSKPKLINAVVIGIISVCATVFTIVAIGTAVGIVVHTGSTTGGVISGASKAKQTATVIVESPVNASNLQITFTERLNTLGKISNEIQPIFIEVDRQNSTNTSATWNATVYYIALCSSCLNQREAYLQKNFINLPVRINGQRNTTNITWIFLIGNNTAVSQAEWDHVIAEYNSATAQPRKVVIPFDSQIDVRGNLPQQNEQVQPRSLQRQINKIATQTRAFKARGNLKPQNDQVVSGNLQKQIRNEAFQARASTSMRILVYSAVLEVNTKTVNAKMSAVFDGPCQDCDRQMEIRNYMAKLYGQFIDLDTVDNTMITVKVETVDFEYFGEEIDATSSESNDVDDSENEEIQTEFPEAVVPDDSSVPPIDDNNPGSSVPVTDDDENSTLETDNASETSTPRTEDISYNPNDASSNPSTEESLKSSSTEQISGSPISSTEDISVSSSSSPGVSESSVSSTDRNQNPDLSSSSTENNPSDASSSSSTENISISSSPSTEDNSASSSSSPGVSESSVSSTDHNQNPDLSSSSTENNPSDASSSSSTENISISSSPSTTDNSASSSSSPGVSESSSSSTTKSI